MNGIYCGLNKYNSIPLKSIFEDSQYTGIEAQNDPEFLSEGKTDDDLTDDEKESLMQEKEYDSRKASLYI